MAKKIFVFSWLISTLLFSSTVWAEDVSTLLEEGIYAEETKGDLGEAMIIYQKIIDENDGNSANIAEAYYRLGTCYLKTGDDAKAIEMFKELLTDFRDHEEIASDARFQLAKLNALDEGDQTVSSLELIPAPWESGETCWYTFGTSVIENYGKMILSIRDANIDGKDLWRIEDYVIISGEGQSQFIRIDVLKKDFKPLSSLLKGILGNKVKYETDRIQLDIDSLGTKEKKEISTNNFVYDSNQVEYLIRRLPLKENYSTSLSVFNPAAGNIIKVEARTTGIETVKVPVGTFECYCVELVMDSVKVKYWISIDDKRYLVKYDIGTQGVIELEKIEQVSKDKPVVFNDSEAGISMSSPAGWYIIKSSITAGAKVLINIQSPALKADSSYFFVQQHSGAFKAPQDLPKESMGILKQTFKNYTPRPESWEYGEIDGLPSSTYISDYNKEDKEMVEYRTDILNKQEVYVFILRLEKEYFNELKTDFENIVQSFKLYKTYGNPVTNVLTHYKSPDFNFELDIPELWYTSPPDFNNSPYETIRFGSQQGGSHLLIIYRNPGSSNKNFKEVYDYTQEMRVKEGYRNFITAETTIDSKDVIMLDFDRPMGNGGIWSCRHYFIPDGNYTYILGFGTSNKDGMIDLYDRVAKTFRTE